MLIHYKVGFDIFPGSEAYGPTNVRTHPEALETVDFHTFCAASNGIEGQSSLLSNEVGIDECVEQKNITIIIILVIISILAVFILLVVVVVLAIVVIIVIIIIIAIVAIIVTTCTSVTSASSSYFLCSVQ